VGDGGFVGEVAAALEALKAIKNRSNVAIR
jgi:hypothetical protein